jgi:tetratricopeptide (TPR) repeat protein
VSKKDVTGRRGLVCVLFACAAAACAPTKPPSVDPAIAARATLTEADALLGAGCFDCLASALERYESVRGNPAVASAATAGAVRAAGLLALRERELGTTDSGYLEKARALSATSETLRREVAPLLDLISIMLWRAGAGRSGDPDQPLTIYRNRAQRLEMLQSIAARDELSAYTYLAYACETSPAGTDVDELIAPMDASRPMSQLPLLAFRQAVCMGVDATAVEALLAREPRFAELSFYRGLIASADRKLDDADARYREAYAWRPTWPAATLLIANVAMTGEEFASALEFYDRTLDLAPSFPDALLGRLRALSYLGRAEDALAVADALLGLRRYPGDAYYWRAFNELQLNRLDMAWEDIESAGKAMVNSEVPKLAGIIAMRRRELDVARERLEIARQRNPDDCEAGYYLQLVLGDLRRWPALVEVATRAASCLDAAEAFARSEIDRITASAMSDARKERQIARRQQQIASAIRMRATCFFNAAVGNYNLSKPDEVRRFAERVVNDEEFGERARDLVSRTAKLSAR